MYYSELAKIYSELEGSNKRLDKIEIISNFLKKCNNDDLSRVIYLIQGKVFPHYDERKIGMGSRLILKAIGKATGVSEIDVEKKWKTKGDLGEVVEDLISNKKQATLISTKLTVKKVFENITNLAKLEGKGAVGKKVGLVAELLISSGKNEARFIVRTVLEDLRIGVADGVIRDSIAKAYDADVKNVERAFDILLDFGEVARRSKDKEVGNMKLKVGKPMRLMLAIKVEDVKAAFEAVGKPALLEYKLDGFRVGIHKKGSEISLFTRKMENITKQFKEVAGIIKKYVKCKECILDSEFVGYNPKSKRYLPFQNISQRIRRKYEIEKMAKKFPVEINVFDILHYNGKDMLNKTQTKRRNLIEKIVKHEKHKIKVTDSLITDDEKEAKVFFNESLKKGNEGLIFKKLDAMYQPGRRVEGWVKLKTTLEPLDLVIIGAEWGTGKRVGVLSSFVLGCSSGNEFLECGMLGTGIKEKSKNGVSFKELTRLLKPLIISEKGRSVKIKPDVVIQVNYEEIQKSPTYSSGYALRFPRLQMLRSMEKNPKDANTLGDITRLYKSQKKTSIQ